MNEHLLSQPILSEQMAEYLRKVISIPGHKFFENFIPCTQVEINYDSNPFAQVICAEVSILENTCFLSRSLLV